MHTDTPATPAETTAAPNRRYLCRHVFTDGHRCGSPSLRGKDLCYYHTRSRRESACAGRSGTFSFSRIDDRAAIQIALYDVLSRMAGGDIELKRGTALLYGLQIASSNLGRPQSVAEQPPQVEEITFDNDLGDLAPIAEYPEPPSSAVILNEEHRDESKACPEPSRRETDTAHPAPTPDTTQNGDSAVILLSVARSAEPKDPEELHIAPIPGIILPTQAAPDSQGNSENPIIPSATPQPHPPAPHPLRDYNPRERYYLKRAAELLGYSPVKSARPETLTDQDIIASINAARHRIGYNPIENDPTWNPATLSAPLPPHPDDDPKVPEYWDHRDLMPAQPARTGGNAPDLAPESAKGVPLPEPHTHQSVSVAA